MEVYKSWLELRLVNSDGLTKVERQAIDPIAKQLGYENVEVLAIEAGFSSPRDMAQNFHFKNTRDFFLGYGWYDRLADYNRNGKPSSPK